MYIYLLRYCVEITLYLKIEITWITFNDSGKYTLNVYFTHRAIATEPFGWLRQIKVLALKIYIYANRLTMSFKFNFVLKIHEQILFFIQ